MTKKNEQTKLPQDNDQTHALALLQFTGTETPL